MNDRFDALLLFTGEESFQFVTAVSAASTTSSIVWTLASRPALTDPRSRPFRRGQCPSPSIDAKTLSSYFNPQAARRRARFSADLGFVGRRLAV
jgi:hypothetical protein